MKKITFLLLIFVISYNMNSQNLNQSANWPNVNWTVTGTFNTDPTAFEADPTLTANFAFDDDDAGNPSDDDIAAESPTIDLTSFSANGATDLNVTVDFIYNEFDDSLNLEYWDADSATWVIWEVFVETDNAIQDDFCTGVSATFTSINLDITGFSATQLSDFKYRFSFLDDGGAGGGAWEWGFCFSSPTITSIGATAGIADNQISGFNMYPNPANNILNVEATYNIQSITIFNAIGQKVFTVEPNAISQSISIADLNAGFYIVNIVANDEVGAYNLIKK